MKEIERKYLVEIEKFLSITSNIKNPDVIDIVQGYLSSSKTSTTRIRQSSYRISQITKSFLTIKSAGLLSRDEFEYEIPNDDAKSLLKLCDKTLNKSRYLIETDGNTWEVDLFHDRLYGLVIAELEIDSEDENIIIPEWCGKEVTMDKRFTNSNLINEDLVDLK